MGWLGLGYVVLAPQLQTLSARMGVNPRRNLDIEVFRSILAEYVVL